MEYNAFIDSLQEDDPSELNPYLLSLWHDGKGDWNKAHHIIQEIDTAEAALIHAYLHRKEGDTWNADYWYRQAGVASARVTLETEWKDLVRRYLDKT